MKIINIHNEIDKNIEVYSRMEPKYSRSAQDVWKSLEDKIDRDEKRVFGNSNLYKKFIGFSLAAVIVVGFILVGFSFLYEKEVTTLKGQHTQFLLPDDSQVRLNANSTVKYKPFWWHINRSLSLTGEAFFNVKKGSEFSVLADGTTTQVLGTTFNVYSRKGKVEVSCFTGLVRVTRDHNSVELKPNEKVNVTENGLLAKDMLSSDNRVNAWLRSELYWEATPLDQVFYDLELQYNIEFEIDQNINVSQLKYSGYYKMEQSVENVLNLVCKPFGIKYEKLAKGKCHLIYDN